MNALVVVIALAGATAVAPAAEPDRSKAPPPGAENPWTPPEAQRFAVHGMEAYLVERHDLPIVELAIGWSTGDVVDPLGKEGMHGLCADLVGEGTLALDKNALEDKKADLGLILDVGAGREAARLGLRVAKDRLGPSLELAGALLTSPGLRAADFERLRAQRKAAVLQAKGNVDGASARVLGPVMFGRDHPYGHVATAASLDAITLDDCKKVAAELRPDGAALVVVGDVTKAELAAAFDQHMASFAGKAPATPKVGPPQPKLKGTLFFVDVPGAAQSRITVAWPGPPRAASDYWATTVMAQVLGGGMPSRIVQNLRERNGYTYGARAGFNYARTSSTMQIGSSVRTDVTGKALIEVMNELKGMTAEPPTEEEVAREKLGGIRALPNRFGTGSSTLASIWELLFYYLPLDTWQKMPAEVKAVTPASVAAAVKAHLKSDGVTVIVAGDKAKVFAELEDVAKLYGKDGVVVLDADGLPAH